MTTSTDDIIEQARAWMDSPEGRAQAARDTAFPEYPAEPGETDWLVSFLEVRKGQAGYSFTDPVGLATRLARARSAAQRLTPEMVQGLMDAKLRISVKPKLTEHDRVCLRIFHTELADHPCLLLVGETLLLLEDPRVNGPELPSWWADYKREVCWEWSWWADYMHDGKLEAMKSESLTPAVINVITAAGKPPEGWLPKSRR